MIRKGLPIVMDGNTKTLIVGTFPSEKSLAAGQYYANPANDFWKLVGVVLDKDFKNADYPIRIKWLLDAGIGLWDVYSSCEREGSLDKKIRNAQLNDFTTLLSRHPSIGKILTNGQNAFLIIESHIPRNISLVPLPSSSPANRRNQQMRISQWKKFLR